MKSENSIFIAFILNLAFSVFEFFGGIFIGSVSIVSDALHDFGDALGIGVSYILERKSKREADEKYTYGYGRYSVIGGVIITMILIFGSFITVYNALKRIIDPVSINYDGMIVFAIVGVLVNSGATFFTRFGDSKNQKAVNLHMLEDVFGWVVVLVGAIVMRFTDFWLIDPIMSIGVSVFIFINACRNLRDILDLFLEKTPAGIDVGDIKACVSTMDGVVDVHHIHIWSMDGHNNYATMHIVTDLEAHGIKERIREELEGRGIGHVTLELENSEEYCHEKECSAELNDEFLNHHHHHHHH